MASERRNARTWRNHRLPIERGFRIGVAFRRRAGTFAARVEVIFARMVPRNGDGATLTTRIDSVVTVPAGAVAIH